MKKLILLLMVGSLFIGCDVEQNNCVLYYEIPIYPNVYACYEDIDYEEQECKDMEEDISGNIFVFYEYTTLSCEEFCVNGGIGNLSECFTKKP